MKRLIEVKCDGCVGGGEYRTCPPRSLSKRREPKWITLGQQDSVDALVHVGMKIRDHNTLVIDNVAPRTIAS